MLETKEDSAQPKIEDHRVEDGIALLVCGPANLIAIMDQAIEEFYSPPLVPPITQPASNNSFMGQASLERERRREARFPAPANSLKLARARGSEATERRGLRSQAYSERR
jgi:hypothetical protein